MKSYVLSILLCSSVLGGCASQFKLHPQPLTSQTKFINYGQDVIVSKKTSVVMVWPKNFLEESNAKFGINVLIKNIGDKPTVIETDNIKATFNGKKLATFTAHEVLAEIEKSQRVSAALAAIGGAMSEIGAASSAGRTYETGTVTGYNTTTGENFRANYTATGYNKAAADRAAIAARADTDRTISNIRQSSAEQAEKYSGQRLLRNTILPGDSYGGAIYFDKISPNAGELGRLTIEITIEGEAHTFAMDVQRI